MKTILVVFICSIYFWLWYPNTDRSKPIDNISSQRQDTINYKTQVQPILQKNCSPCHFPGGKQYEKLPFDQGFTIIHHEAGVFKRIKKEEEMRLIRQYITQNKISK